MTIGDPYPHDPNNPCKKCGQAHLTSLGKPSCHGHIYNSDPPRPCHKVPFGKDHGKLCKAHGGTSPALLEATKKRRAFAAIRNELDSLGGTIEVDPAEAMITCVRESAWNVAFLRKLVEPLKGGGEGPVVFEDDGEPRIDHEGLTQVTSTSMRIDPHILVKMYNEERDRLMRYSKLCADAGVEERKVRIAEAQGEWLVNTIDRVLDHLQLTEDQRIQLPAIMGRVVAELGSGDAG